METKKRICLFDVDGTLTKPRNPIEQPMIDTLLKLKEKVHVGVVSGSDLPKATQQLTKPVIEQMDWVFAENGLYAIKNNEFYQKKSLKDYLGEEKIKQFVNFCLKYIADIDIPIKRGTFIEYRTGMINVSPIGRNCSQEERDEFEKYDHEHNIRKQFVKVLEEKFSDFGLKFSIGGQISFDVFPQGWDKTYCLQFLSEYDEIRFFGDKTYEGGNDYEIYASEKTIGHSVKNYNETIEQLTQAYNL